MSDVKPKVGEWWICNLVSVMGNGDSRSAYKMTPALIVACNVLPIERLYTQKDNDRMVEEIAELREAFKEVKSIALQELEWRLEDSECGMCEVEEAKDRLSYKIDSLLAKLQKGEE